MKAIGYLCRIVKLFDVIIYVYKLTHESYVCAFSVSLSPS